MNEYRLNELGSVNRGRSRHRPRNDPSLYDGEFPFIQTGDVKHSPFYITSHSQTYNEKGLSQSKIWPAGTLCITIAANIADTAILSYPACFPDSIIGFLPDKEKSEVKYVKYCLDTFKLQMQSISQGTTQDNMSLEKLLSIAFPAPKLRVQRKIAAILTAYDDLIETNERRIALLEKMVEELYREWFIRMRFPGHEGSKFIKGVPADWGYECLDKLCLIIKRGVSPAYSEASESLVINQKCIRGRRLNLGEARRHSTNVPDDKIIRYADALVNSTGVGTLGRVCCVEFQPTDLTVDSHVTICRANDKAINAHYLSHTICQLQPYFEFMAAGSTGQVELNKSLIDGIKVRVPPRHLQNMFAEQISPIWDQKQNIFTANARLTETRDLLLPRLISGKLSVKDLDIQFPPSMQQEDTEPEHA